MTGGRTDLDDTDATWPTWEPAPGPADVLGSPGTGVVAAAWSACSTVGRVRPHNEDRWGQYDARWFVVADGMGGHEGGGLAAEVAVETALRPGVPRWHDRLTAANIEVRARTAAAGFERSGSTLVVAALDEGRATIVSVGDSRVYRLRDAHLEQLTQDHTVRGELLAAGIDADRHTSPRAARGLTSYLGIEPERLRIDVVAVHSATGDRLLLCSDGVHTLLHHDQLSDALHGGTPQAAVERLMRLSDAAGGRDNATAIVIDLQRQDTP